MKFFYEIYKGRKHPSIIYSIENEHLEKKLLEKRKKHLIREIDSLGVYVTYGQSNTTNSGQYGYKIKNNIHFDLCRGSKVNIFDLYYDKFGNLNIAYSNITNHFYLTVDSSQQNKLKPFINQYDGNINYLKIRYNKEFKFGIFSLDNSIIFQNVKLKKRT